jgi:hypothetical protein
VIALRPGAPSFARKTVIGSTYRLPCIDMPRIDMPRLGSTVVSTYSIAMSPTSQFVVAPHATYPIAITNYNEHAIPFVTIQVFLRDLPVHTR